jgi:membrane-anchored protein YejM (alkaline phosphatase superfamily)
VALNVPVARLLSTPLTWPLLRAAGMPLADSISFYVTWGNVLLMLLLLSAAVVFPLQFRRLPPRALAAVGVVALLLVGLGPRASARLETLGLHRNALVVLAVSIFPRVTAAGESGDWRLSPFPVAPSDDLSHYRGAAAGRHVILISLESTAAQHLRPYGAPEDPMPNLTALSQQAILFTDAYAVYPESIKGLFSVLCARYPAFDTAPEIYARLTSPSLAAVLAAAGYRTGLFHSGRFGYLGMESIIRERGFETLEDAGEIGGQRESSFGVDEPATVRRILSWIGALPRDERFFLTYLPIAGHHPYAAAEAGPFPEDDELGRYRNALHEGDAALGALLRGLRERGLEERTLLVIYGDHGEAFGQHPGNFGHTLFVYEENVRVPYLIVAPGLLRGQMRVRRVASLIDTAPTILDLLGLPAPGAYQGQSLLEARARLALFFTDYSLGWLGLRDERWKFIHGLDGGRAKLFDLREDPEERRNLAGQFPARVSAYRQHLLRWSSSQRELVTRSR